MLLFCKAKPITLNGQTYYDMGCSLACNISLHNIVEHTLSGDFYNICCQENNCNNITIPAKVSSCYASGHFAVQGYKIYLPYTRQHVCSSPRNQYCIVYIKALFNALFYN